MATIYPSLYAADLLNIQKEIKQLDPYCEGYHIDVMDNQFVPNLTWGPRVINSISSATERTLWVHLMVANPRDWLDTLMLPPFSILTIHLESSTKDIRNIIKHIKEKKWLPSIAIKPKTSVKDVFPLLDDIHQVLIMSVEPGFSGQQFLPNTLKKIGSLVGFRQTSGIDFKIGMDGGIGKDNIALLAEKGVDDLAVGSAIFEQSDPIEALQQLKTIIATHKADITEYHKVKKSEKKR